jgi:hypothetical protein
VTVTDHGQDVGEDLVVLHRDEADDLARLLDRVEDWLRHAGDDARTDLAVFLNTAGNGALAAAGLIDLLGAHATVLHRRIKQVSR